jgi:hypothetical protein
MRENPGLHDLLKYLVVLVNYEICGQGGKMGE